MDEVELPAEETQALVGVAGDNGVSDHGIEPMWLELVQKNYSLVRALNFVEVINSRCYDQWAPRFQD